LAGKGPTPDQLLIVSRAYGPLPAADGALVFASDMGGHIQPYRVRSAGSWPLRLTSTADRTIPLGLTPLGILAAQDHGGNETWQLTMIDGDGLLKPLTRDPKAIHKSVTVAPDGGRAGLAYNPGGQDDFRLGVIDLATGDLEDWLAPAGMWSWEAWSPDGGEAAIIYSAGSTSSQAFLLRRGGEPRPILPGAARVESVHWTWDGRLYARADLDSDFIGVHEIDPEQPDRSRRQVVADEADVVLFKPDHAGKKALLVTNRGPFDALQLLDLASGRVGTTFDLPPGTLCSDLGATITPHAAWAPDGAAIFVAWETPTSASDLYELRAGTRWTLAAPSWPGLVTPERTSYRTFDGLQIPAMHYRIDDRPRPTLVYFHGGPSGQSRGNYYQPMFQVLLAAGINVFAPDVRGSTGYGLRYQLLDEKELRWDSVRDGCEAARHLKREGLATRIAAMGRSYGGFMTLGVLVEDPDLWDAGVDIVGIANWYSFFKNTSGWRRAHRMQEYGDPEGSEAEVLKEFSPLHRAHTIKAPLLIIHGRNDVRVPVSEAEQMSRAAPEAELLVLEDEGHGISRHANMVRAYGRALQFLVDRLGVDGAAGPRPPEVAASSS
jgi:dipeptidyl aminopeptidase/acylaminoacyl peptidase